MLLKLQQQAAVESSLHGPKATHEYQKTEHYQKEQLCSASIAMDTASDTDGTATYAELNDEVGDG